MLLGRKVSDGVAQMRDLPVGIDQRGACRRPDWTGPDDLEIKIGELREITDWEKPIYVKVGATRTYYDVQLAVKAGADVIVVDGMQGGTAATQDVFIEHVGIPTLPAVRPAVHALPALGMHRQAQLIVSLGIPPGPVTVPSALPTVMRPGNPPFAALPQALDRRGSRPARVSDSPRRAIFQVAPAALTAVNCKRVVGE